MEELVEGVEGIAPPSPGSLVEGTIVNILKNKILVDLDGYCSGEISGQEAHDSMDTAKDLKVGDVISAYVLEEENENGLVVLSLRKASQEKTWTRFTSAYETGKSIDVVPSEANKGGLLLNVDGIKGFIPVSQLAPLHYPRVDGADASEILTRLQKLVGEKLKVRIINIDAESGKLILSEKAAEQDMREDAISKLELGQKLSGKISGIVKFGIFVTFEGLEGLVHISEIAWGHVKDPHDYGKLGDAVDVLVIGKDKDKISLSMKRLVPDPWVEATKKFKVGTEIEGEINRVTPFGAFMKLDDEINGLIHVSEFSGGEDADPSQIVKVGEKIKAKVIAIDPDEHRIGLSIKALTEEPSEEEPKKEKAAKEEKKSEDEAVEESKDEAAEKTTASEEQ